MTTKLLEFHFKPHAWPVLYPSKGTWLSLQMIVKIEWKRKWLHACRAKFVCSLLVIYCYTMEHQSVHSDTCMHDS